MGFAQKTNKILLINFLALSVLQGLNILLPFLTIPFIIQKAGIASFGLLSYAHTLALLFVVVVEFGFNTTTTREISIHSENKQKVEQIYGEVFTSKMVLLGISFLVFSVFVCTVEKFRAHLGIHFLYFGIVIGNAFFPLWLFQGLQKMKYITYINVFFKSIFTFCIFLFLKDNSNIWVVPFFLSLGAITSGIASLFVAHYKFGISLYLTSFNSVKEQLKSAYHLFMSEIYMAVIAYSGVLILGFFSNNTIVGIYASAEKVIRTAGSMLSPIISALFPHVSKMMHEEPRKGKLFLEKIKNWGILLIVATTIVVFFLADYIFLVIFGTENSESVLAFRIMILFPLFSFLDQLYGKLVLVTLGKSALFFKVLSVISIMGMLINIVFSYKLGYIGTAIASTVIQFTFALGMYLSAQKALKATTK